MTRLFELSEERIAVELRHAEQAELDSRQWSRRVNVTLAVAGAWYVIGMTLIALAFRTTNGDLAGVFFSAGVMVSSAGPVYTGLWFWSQLDS